MQGEEATGRRTEAAVHLSVVLRQGGLAEPEAGGPGAGLRLQADYGDRSGGNLTEVWLIGAPLELDSSGTSLYQEMSHQLMGQVPWDERKEMRIGHFPCRPPTASQHRFLASPVHRALMGERVVATIWQEP